MQPDRRVTNIRSLGCLVKSHVNLGELELFLSCLVRFSVLLTPNAVPYTCKAVAGKNLPQCFVRRHACEDLILWRC